jgi:hypothetical protein
MNSNHNNTRRPVRIRFLSSSGTFAVFDGSKNCNSNSPTVEAAVEVARRLFPGRSIVVKDFFKA